VHGEQQTGCQRRGANRRREHPQRAVRGQLAGERAARREPGETSRDEHERGRERVQRRAFEQPAPSAMDQRLDRRDGGLFAAGELAVAATFEGVTDKCVALARRQSADRPHQPVHPLALLDRLRGRRPQGDGVLWLLERECRRRRTNDVDRRVADDRKQPGSHVLWCRSARREMPVGAQERLLKHVLGELGAATELAAREAQQLGAVHVYERAKRLALVGCAAWGLPSEGTACARDRSVPRPWCGALLVFV
jgi:hypothetical protein